MNKLEIKNLISKENPIIFEIGCADGGDTLEFINTFSDLEIYCFEPEPKNIKLVKEKINYPKHHLFDGVVSDINGEVIFNRSRTDNPQDLSYSGSIKKPKEHLNEWSFIKFDEEIVVKSITLDKFCNDKQIKLIDFIWADVQGAEENLILGGLKTLNEKARYFYTEYSNKEYYEGQLKLNELLFLMGPNWDVIKDFGSDILLKNKNL